MNQFFAYGILILLALTSCQKNKNGVLVKGKFIGEIPKEIKYSVPINGICGEWFNSTAKVDSLGNFQLSVDADEPCFMKILYSAKMGQLVIEPEESYNVTFNSNTGNNKFNVDCKNKIVQEEYQKLASPMHPQMLIREFINSPISLAKNKIDSMYNKEVTTFEKLSSNGLIEKELFDMILLDRKLLYSCAQGHLAMINFSQARFKDNSANTDSINQMWNETVSSVSLDSNNLLKSKWAYYYLENYLMFHEYTTKDFSFEVRAKARKEGNIHSYLLGIAKKYLDANVLEFYTSAYILSMAKQHKFENELIALFAEFKNEFPENKYTEYLDASIKEIVDFHEKVAKKSDKEINIIDNYENVNSFADCIKRFNGNKIYIDIWSTSCGSCKEEFAYNEELSKLLESKDIKKLYISLDGDSNEKRWRDMIIYYNLNGYHIRANDNLYSNMKSLFDIPYIPRYLLIDEKGVIINYYAKSPTQLKELENQLNEK